LHPARQKILEYLKRHGQATIDELADHLDMAPVSVRHHLDLLIGDNLVEASRVRRQAGAGRPKRLYALTPHADAFFPNQYQALAQRSLDVLKRVLSPEDMQRVMEELAEDILQQAPADLESLPPQERLQRAIAFLNSEGYMAFCECPDDQYILHTCHCPYRELAEQHPEICHIDDVLVRRLTGMTPLRVTKIVSGGTRCTYRLISSEKLSPVDLDPISLSADY